MPYNEIMRIQDQLKRSFEGDAWHGPALNEVLSNISAETAAARPLENAHSIWEITLHIRAWQNAVKERLQGTPVSWKDVDDWPAVQETSEAAWQQLQSDLKASFESLLKSLESVDESKLDQPIAEGFSSYYATIHGLIQHNLYHAGQIVMLNKMLTSV